MAIANNQKGAYSSGELHATHGTPRAAIANGDRMHTVKPGDTLWDLAAKYYGDAWEWQRLFDANVTELLEVQVLKGHKGLSDRIYPGMRLLVPRS